MNLPVVIVYGFGISERIKTSAEVVEVSVPQVGSDEAPIAAEWNDLPPEDADVNWGAFDQSGRGYTRYYQGKHWRPVLFNEHGLSPTDRARPLDAETSAQDLLKIAYPFDDVLGTRREFGLTLSEIKIVDQAPSDGDLHYRVASDRERAINLAQEACNELIMVNGIVYESCSEPTVVMLQNYSNGPFLVSSGYIRISTDVGHIGDALSAGVHNVAPLSEFRSLYELHRLFDPHRTSEINLIREPIIHDSESLDLSKFISMACQSVAHDFIDKEGQYSMSRASRDQLRTIASLKDAMDLSLADRDPEDALDAFEEAFSMAISAWPKSQFADDIKQINQYLEKRQLSVSSRQSPERTL